MLIATSNSISIHLDENLQEFGQRTGYNTRRNVTGKKISRKDHCTQDLTVKVKDIVVSRDVCPISLFKPVHQSVE